MHLDLTPDLIDTGKHLLDFMVEKGLRIRACFWLYFPEADRWGYVVASPEVRIRGSTDVYGKIFGLARQVPGAKEMLGLGDVTALKDNDPLVLALRKVPIGRGIQGTRLRGSLIHGQHIDDAYVYRLPSPKASKAVATSGRGAGARTRRTRKAAGTRRAR
jgi:hypothetical protein